MFGILTPVLIGLNLLTVKYASKKRGMDTMKLNFNSMLLSNVFIIIFAIIYWNNIGWETVKPRAFIVGTLIGISSSLGKTLNTKANVSGYGGVAGTIASMNGPYTVIVECILTSKMISVVEVLSLLICVFGSAILVLHAQIYKALCCCVK